MYLRHDALNWSASAPAKLNLYLEVVGSRGDGYHELETVMVPIRLADHLNLAVTHPSFPDQQVGEITLRTYDARGTARPPFASPLPAEGDNLVVRALRLLQERSGTRLGAQVLLGKRIPLAAGLGGGSSDAATALRLANRAWQLGWSNQQLSDLASELGSDTPFFIDGRAAVCRGRGEQVQPLQNQRALHVVVVKPPCDLHAADVFRTYDTLSDERSAAKPSAPRSLPPEVFHRWAGLTRWLHNGLQDAARVLSPWIDRLRHTFQQLDFAAHQLSGSGSAYFGICRHAQHARRLASILRTRQLGFVYATRSC